jgi:hypothetical protein
MGDHSAGLAAKVAEAVSPVIQWAAWGKWQFEISATTEAKSSIALRRASL